MRMDGINDNEYEYEHEYEHDEHEHEKSPPGYLPLYPPTHLPTVR